MATQVQFRRGTTADISTFIGADGEVVVDTTKKVCVIHDGVQVAGYPLLREDGSNSALSVGSLSNCALKFVNDPNTGIISPGADQVALVTGGSSRLSIDSAGSVTIPGNLLVSGSITGSITFDNGSAGLPAVRFTNDPDTGIYLAGTNQLAISTGGSGRLFVDASGNVGIGITPTTRFHVFQAGSTQAGLIETNQSASVINFKSTGQSSGQPQVGCAASDMILNTNGSERFRIDSSGRVGIGTSTARAGLTVALGSASIPSAGAATGSAVFSNGSDSGVYGLVVGANTSGVGYIQSQRTDGTATTYDLVIQPNGGRVGIGTTNPSAQASFANQLVIGKTSTDNGITILTGSAKDGSIIFNDGENTSTRGYVIYRHTTDSLDIGTNGLLRATVDSSGRLLVGTSTYDGNGIAVFQGNTSSSTGAGAIDIRLGTTRPTAADTPIGYLRFMSTSQTSGNNQYANIAAFSDGASTSDGDIPGRLVFSTTADGASSPTERMRITQGGTILVGKTSNDQGSAGMQFVAGGRASFATDGSECIYVNRNTNDGNLIELAQGGTIEGTISVSGTTVSYNGAHLSRWSQLPSGQERTQILRGSVLSNIDEMCEWGDEENEQLNRMKVSDVEGDKNVSGVFQGWDDDDDTYTNDFYCAMTGDFIIRIGAGITVERGDLLMSAGDGTAKPQDDDIIRSKTIAKVTSTNVSCTYEDGSYCVPCVLMAC